MKLRSVAIASLALVGAFGVAGCRNPPSAQRVALEMVETLDVDESVKACMRDKIQNDYTAELLQEIGDAAAEGQTQGVEALQGFEDDLADCNRR